MCTKYILYILCFIDRASRYIRVMKTNLMYCLSVVYFVDQTLYVSGIFIAQHLEEYYMYTTIGTCRAFLVAVNEMKITREPWKRMKF